MPSSDSIYNFFKVIFNFRDMKNPYVTRSYKYSECFTTGIYFLSKSPFTEVDVRGKVYCHNAKSTQSAILSLSTKELPQTFIT